MSRHLIVTLRNNNIGASNEAVVDFDFADVPNPPTINQLAAYTAAYFNRSAMIAGTTSITGMKWKTNFTAAAYVDLAFPSAEWAVLQAANPTLPIGFTYGVSFGAGGLLPLGTSLCVQEKTATAGRSFRGRHFVPFISAGTVNSNGAYFQATIDTQLQTYRDWFFGVKPATLASNPVVVSRKLVVSTPITLVSASLIPSNLKSRRR